MFHLKSLQIFTFKIHKINVHQIRILRNFCSSNSSTSSPLSDFSIFHVKKTLKQSGISFDDGFTCIKTSCPVCQQPELIQEKIFINKTTGQFICPGCQHSGDWKILERFFTSRNKIGKTLGEVLQKIKQSFIESKPKIEVVQFPRNENETKFNDLSTTKKEEILHSLNINVPVTAFMNLNTYYDSTVNRLIFPLSNVDGHIIGSKTLQNNPVEESTDPEIGCHGVILVKPTVSKSKDSAVVVLSVVDLLALNSQKINMSIICLPNGVKSLPQECLPALEKFQKLILWFNYDVPGWDSARNFARKLDERRCLFVRPTDVHPTPYIALQQNLDLKAILTKSHPILHKSITTFSSLRQDVLSDLQNIDKVQGVKWKRYPILNKYLKGHRKGELTILTGPTGCGKTTFMSDYSLDLALQGVNTLWGSFEIRNTRLASTLLRQMAGKPLDENLTDFEYWADEFEKLPIYFMTFHGQQSIKIVMEV